MRWRVVHTRVPGGARVASAPARHGPGGPSSLQNWQAVVAPRLVGSIPTPRRGWDSPRRHWHTATAGGARRANAARGTRAHESAEYWPINGAHRSREGRALCAQAGVLVAPGLAASCTSARSCVSAQSRSPPARRAPKVQVACGAVGLAAGHVAARVTRQGGRRHLWTDIGRDITVSFAEGMANRVAGPCRWRELIDASVRAQVL